VTDDTHHGVDGIWRGDSVQTAFAEGGQYGPKINLGRVGGETRHSRGNVPTGPFQGRDLVDIETIEANTARQGSETTYELAVPWRAVFAERPVAGDELPFSFIANDNDGEGRKGWIQWTAGVGSNQSAENLGSIELVPGDVDWHGHLLTPATATSGETATVYLYVPNYTASRREFTITGPGGSEKRVDVPARSARREPFDVSVRGSGDQVLEATVSAANGDRSITVTDTLEVRPARADLLARYDDLEAAMDELRSLLEDARSEGMATEYPVVDATTVQRFIEYGRSDVEHDELRRAGYVANQLEAIYA
jgi:hypothetical protein